MRYGTSYFVSHLAAMRYYRSYGYDRLREAVDRKIAAGEIHIGKPPTKPGQICRLIDGGTRYEIEDWNFAEGRPA